MTTTGYEEIEATGAINELDIDYLEHLQVPEVTEEVAMEGILRAVGHDAISGIADSYREMKGWFLGIESKRKYIISVCDDIIEWLEDKDREYKNLDLDLGTFKTWMKTSATFFWRYYFLLNDKYWKQIEQDLKDSKITGLEALYSIDFKDRKDIATYLDSIDNIKDLIKIVKLYKERTNKFFDLILKRKTKIKAFPFQVILLGTNDLRRTVKKIVNLAI